MAEETILKRKGVQLVKKRMKEFLKPFGFQPYPHSSLRFVRVREEFIDDVILDTSGYHLQPQYLISLHCAPFEGLTCDRGRLWRTAKEEVTTYLFWECELTEDCVGFYYMDHFEAVWRDVAYTFEHYVLPQMDAMTDEGFRAQLTDRSRDDRDFFLAYNLVPAIMRYGNFFAGAPEVAVYGVDLWRLGSCEEAIPYLRFAQMRYRESVEFSEDKTGEIYLCRLRILEVLDTLLSLWDSRVEGWDRRARELLDKVAADWMEYVW